MRTRDRLEAFKNGAGPYSSAPAKPEPPASRTRRTVSAEKEAWRSMLKRCHNPRTSNYADYGGRGIAVCDEWRDRDSGFERFYAHVGQKPSSEYSLDRIDNDRGYEPGNERWADRATQSANRRPWTHRPRSWIVLECGARVLRSRAEKERAQRELISAQMIAEGWEPGT